MIEVKSHEQLKLAFLPTPEIRNKPLEADFPSCYDGWGTAP